MKFVNIISKKLSATYKILEKTSIKMGSTQCAKCGKSVKYVEEIKCLEKIWHMSCFKCEVCKIALTVNNNYEGFDKLPYCGAHVPKAKATTVVDTPEMRRLADFHLPRIR